MDERTADSAINDGVSGAADSWPLSAREAASVLGVSERTIRRAIARGDLPATKRAGVFRIAPADLARFKRQRLAPLPQPHAAPGPPRLISFPPRDRPVVPQLPRPSSPLIGRDREIAVLRSLPLRGDGPLVTLTGPGGVGKTRLALAAAAEVADAFPDGVWFISLASIRTPELVVPAIAQALGIRAERDGALVDRLTAFLRQKRTMLLLDNFEQVVEAAPVIAGLLRVCPNLVVMVTSRLRLRLSGEREVPVPPLALPDAGARFAADGLATIAAVQLFVECTQRARPDFALSNENADEIAAICRRLDGLPLAIELAAARVKVLSTAALLARLERRLPLLTGGGRDLPARQQTMRDTVAWSYDLLTPDEQALFRRLTVFDGGFSLDAVEVVANPTSDGAKWVFAGIAGLVDASLLQSEPGPGGEPRYLMLETMRDFGLELLTAGGEGEAARRAHAAYFLALAERYELAELTLNGARSVAALESEQANLRAALTWLEGAGETVSFLRLAAALGHFWSGQALYLEGRSWLQRALAQGNDAPTADRSRALVHLGMIEAYQGESLDAEDSLTIGLAGCQAQGDAIHTALALLVLGALANLKGNLDRGEALLVESLSAAQTIADQRLSEIMAGWALINLAVVPRTQGNHALAGERLEEALRRLRHAGYIAGMTLALGDLGDLARDRGDYGRALGLYWEALDLGQEHPGTRVVTDVIEAVAVVAAAVGQAARGARLLGAVEARREQTGLRFRVAENQLALERAMAATRAALGESAFATAWAAGRNLRPAQAVAEAIEPFEIMIGLPGALLTARELEILRLLAAGLTDPAIAASLFISVRTVENHVSHILAKLGVRTRTGAVSVATARGLVAPGTPA